MNRNEFFYELPENLIAQTPLNDRSQSRLMLLNKGTGQIEHKTFHEITGLLNPNDCLVLNDTKVIPARLIGEKAGKPVEILLLNRKNDMWEVLVKPGKRAKIGDILTFGNNELAAEVIDITEGGNRLVKFTCSTIFEEALDRLGEMPLPPYISKKLQDKNRYQTVYAKYEGSAAAPTAGLHFTNELLSSISEMGVKIATVTLHVGLGTFRPVKEDDILQHKMHSEYFVLEQAQADIINQTKKNGGRIICVGTTSCRTLETCAEYGYVKPKSGWTDIFIYPGYRFNVVDCLITNFHLPESTLVMLVSAMARKEHVLNAYAEAIKNEYRFFSFGDAMFIY